MSHRVAQAGLEITVAILGLQEWTTMLYLRSFAFVFVQLRQDVM